MANAASQNFLNKITKRSDIAVALMLVLIIFMMILPLPTLLIDTLIALNMSLAIILLMVGVYLSSPLSFSAFPAVLLLTTIFRLALSISTTRLILTEADAGKIIQTFGDFVVQGNMIVGLVVFLIITIVQFVVITKGSERIAEVGARFTLDAMPGKQMSIDSDLRAGVITMHDARDRRTKLEKESQLFGAMDGAMKFVKGDAIAGLIIIIVNIIGGISIGSFQRGMPIGEAMELYSILTIGDGLVSQIPALFVSITAGIIVSRVTVEEEGNLGSDIGKQVLGEPNALLIGGGVVFLMGLVPGFPFMVFLTLAFVLCAIGFIMKRFQTRQDFAENEEVTVIGQGKKDSGPALGQGGTLALDAMQPLAPLLVELPDSARPYFSLPDLNDNFTEVREKLYKDLGVQLDGISLSLSNILPDDVYQISIHGTPVGQGMLGLHESNPQNDEAIDMGGNLPQPINREEDNFTPVERLTRHVAFLIRRHADEFIGIQEVDSLMSKLESSGYSTLVQEAQRAVPNTRIVEILKRLLSEGISIRDMRQILGTMVEFGEQEKDNGILTERVRVGLKRQLSFIFTRGKGVLPVYMFDPESEKLIQSNVRQTPTGVHLALPTELAKVMESQLQRLEEKHRDALPRPVVLTSMELRQHLRSHLSTKFPDLPILSLPELTNQVSVQPVGELRMLEEEE